MQRVGDNRADTLNAAGDERGFSLESVLIHSFMVVSRVGFSLSGLVADMAIKGGDLWLLWQETKLEPASNRYAWPCWATTVTFASKGYYEIWARAFDDKGSAQPFRQPWNPKGYLGNVIHSEALLDKCEGNHRV